MAPDSTSFSQPLRFSHALGESTEEQLRKCGVDPALVRSRVIEALTEDLAYGPDVTTAATVGSDQRLLGVLSVRRPGVVAGIPVVRAVLDVVIGAHGWTATAELVDGSAVESGEVLLAVEAPAQGLLTAERTALNFLGHLSGVATLTDRWAKAVAPHAKVRDTRKTTPGLRELEKYAVRCGGGVNHRFGLGDAALIKDNHIAAAGGVAAAIAAVRGTAPNIPLEVECDTVEQVEEASRASATLILLDNMSTEDMRRCVAVVKAYPGVELEASGGLTLERAGEVAATGVKYLAVGALTHSAPALDIGLDVQSIRSVR